MMIKATNRFPYFVIAILFFNVIIGLNTNTSASLQGIHQQMNFWQTLFVGGTGPNNYSTIQDAVDNTSDGDMVFVYQGIYSEHVLITNSITVIGESRDHTIIDGGGTGNVVKIQASGVNLTQFSLQNGGIGVYIVYSSNVTVIRNTITNNWEGVGLLYSSECLVSGNTIAHNGFEGINPVQTSFITISDNSIFDHLQGIYLVESTYNLIFGNTLSGNSRGVEVQESSDNNHIFHNNFLGNEQDNAYDTCSNSWDDGYPSGGNHWSDYTGTDSDGDGIGDTSYDIPGGDNQDRYPFMEPDGWAPQTNHPPDQPDKPAGETNGDINTPYTYTTQTDDTDSDQVYYNWSWGDGSYSGWLGPYNSGEEATAKHTWTTEGDYSIKVKAKDTEDAESDWSDPLPITMPCSYNIPIQSFFDALFEPFPKAFPVLRQFLGY